ncbi:MAG: 23S rRNA (uracil(1939)-C(5))-methyltransferase RlmD [Bernardetiaceae bacterium]|nr:23S rRNA (uracil(1939)-C(5))-methyltransferase RlmD [Bernardetiaceae bacterium]
MGRRHKNIILEDIEILDVGSEGKCIAKSPEGAVIFVTGVAPGDRVDLRVTRKKKSYMEAQPIAFRSYSPKRVTPFCEVFGTCGGCKWQHLPYEAQLFYKEKQVLDNLQRIGKTDLGQKRSILPAPQTTYYRNKLEFTFSPHRWLSDAEINSDKDFDRRALGFHIPGRFDRLVDISHCYLQAEPSNEIRNALRQWAIEQDLSFYDVKIHKGLFRNLIIRTTSTGELMVIVQFGQDDKENIQRCLQFLAEQFPQINSLAYIINTKKNETFHDLEVHTFAGLPYITEKMENLDFRISAKSFFQTNSEQALSLYRIVRDFAGLTGDEVVYDLYTGTGTIANFVAAKASQVIGIEYVPQAIEDAKINAQINKIENTAFYAGDIKDLLNEDFIANNPAPDVIITDPPRAGMHADVVQTIIQLSPQRIVYVSCNPATQARDLALLSEHYRVCITQPVDMFPHTHHVENVLLLEKKL